MRRRTETHQRDSLAGLHLGTAQRAIADHTRAQQRRGLEVVERVRQTHCKRLRHDESIGVPAVDRPSREVGVLAEVLLAPAAVRARPVGAVEPGDADALADVQLVAAGAEPVDETDGLMPGHDRQVRELEVALDDMEVGATAPARVHADAHLARSGLGHLSLDERERAGSDRRRAPQLDRTHDHDPRYVASCLNCGTSRGAMADLPTGTVTFLFTDVEGSTRLWEEQPDAMKGALARHDEIVHEAVRQHTGHIVKTTGDGVHAVFNTAADGVVAAVDAQLALSAEPWPDATALRVRMGLHTGEADLRDGDYYGPAPNRAARLAATAHGGQIVVSRATEAVVRERLADGVTLDDLGEHRL